MLIVFMCLFFVAKLQVCGQQSKQIASVLWENSQQLSFSLGGKEKEGLGERMDGDVHGIIPFVGFYTLIICEQ